jgi:signal transduction histidine kinase/CheY-like chemotaxis protein
MLELPEEALTLVLEPLKNHLDSERKSKPVENWEDEIESDQLSFIAETLIKFDLRSSLLIPIMTEGRYIGGICLLDRKPRQWTIVDIVLAEAISSHLGETAGRLDLLEAIQKQARTLQRILDTVQEGIFTLDEEKRILFVNRPAREFLSLLADKRPGEILVDLGGRPLEDLLTQRADGLPHEVGFEDEKPRTFEVYVNPVVMGNEEAGWTILLRDVTEVRQVQARVQEQIRRGAVGQLAAGIAHDFNNIVASIILYSEMILSTPELSDKGRQRVSTIIEQANRAATLTRQILDFSRRGIMEPHPVDLVPYFEEITKLLERTLPENIDLQFKKGPDEYIVHIDPGRLQQVIMNLAVNAREAMPAGGELIIELSREEITEETKPPFRDLIPGKWVKLTISDTGIGISDDNLPQVFEPFFTTKPTGESAGLGLAQVFGIVTQHDGFIDVRSEIGEGTAFTIYLPALSVSELSGLIPAVDEPIGGQMETILVVEDDTAMREALVEMLEMMNYRVLSAGDGKQALAVFGNGEGIDLVLSDLVMPEMGGVALHGEIKEKYPKVKMVVMTGYPLAEGGKDLLEQGIVAWLQKPLDVEILARTMRQVLALEAEDPS